MCFTIQTGGEQRRGPGEAAIGPPEIAVPPPREGTGSMTSGWPAQPAVTVLEIAESRGVSVLTVRRDRARFPNWPHPSGSRPRPGRRGRPELEYPTPAIAALYSRMRPASARHAQLEAAQRGRRWKADDRVGGPTAATRLGVGWNTFRLYSATYKGTANPFPTAGADGKWRWGDLTAWK